MRRTLALALLLGMGIATTACGGGGGTSVSNDPKVLTPTKVTTDGAAVAQGDAQVDLKGFDTPTKLDGKCFSDFVLGVNGKDASNMQAYELTFTLKGDPKDTVALYQFLQTNSCGQQQSDTYNTVTQAYASPSHPTAVVSIEISYRTSSGRRLFL